MPRPRQSRRTAVSAFSARSGRSVSRSSPAQPITSPSYRARNIGSPAHERVPLLGTDLQRLEHREVGEHLDVPNVSKQAAHSSGCWSSVEHVDAGRQGRGRRLDTHGAYLLDLAIHLDEPEALREAQRTRRRRPWPGPRRRRASQTWSASRSQQDCARPRAADAPGSTRGATKPPPAVSDRSATPEPTTVPSRVARSSSRSAESCRPHLRDGVAPLARDDRDPDPPPRLVVLVSGADGGSPCPATYEAGAFTTSTGHSAPRMMRCEVLPTRSSPSGLRRRMPVPTGSGSLSWSSREDAAHPACRRGSWSI